MRRIFVAAIAMLAVALSACSPPVDPEGEVYFKSAARQATVLPHYEALARTVFDAMITNGKFGATVTYVRSGGVNYPQDCPPTSRVMIGPGHSGDVQICTEKGHALITEMKNGQYLQSEIIGIRLGDLEVYKGKTDDIVFGQYTVNGKRTGPSTRQKPDQIREADQELIKAFQNRVKIYIES